MSSADRIPLEEIERRMRPGEFSQAGFLGSRESLRAVLDADAHTLAELGLAVDALAARLEQLLVRALESARTVARIDEYRIRLRRYKGPQPCPFAPRPFEAPCPGRGDRRLASIDWSIDNTAIGVQMTGPGLIVHLIAAHGFFEGMESPYRVEPRKLALLLSMRDSQGTLR